MRALAAVALAACSSSTPATLTGHAEPRPVLGPAPQIAWHAGQHPPFELTRLPAVARTGDVAVMPLQDNDAGRGNLNLRLEVRDRADRVVDKIEVMTVDEYEQFVPDGEQPTLPLNNRIADANRKLADLHSQHDLVAMRGFETEADGLVVTFDAAHELHVRPRSGADLATVDGTGWLAKPGQRCAQCPPCDNPARLSGFYKAPGINVVVVRIAYSGTDTCWEPPDQLHVIAW